MDMQTVYSNCSIAIRRLLHEMKTFESSSDDYKKRVLAVSAIFDGVKDDFGEHTALAVWKRTSDDHGESVGILPGWLVKALIKRGCKIHAIHDALHNPL